MICPIVRDRLFLSRRSQEATQDDLQVYDHLVDTLLANQERCAGMAANMIGYTKSIIAVFNGPVVIGMINPQIILKSGPYQVREGCLSLDGERDTVRYQKITVSYLDRSWKRRQLICSGWLAQVIQHEMDHLNGILI